MTSIVPDPNDARQVEVMARAHWNLKILSYPTATWEQLLRLPEGTTGYNILVQERQKMRAALQALADLAKETDNDQNRS